MAEIQPVLLLNLIRRIVYFYDKRQLHSKLCNGTAARNFSVWILLQWYWNDSNRFLQSNRVSVPLIMDLDHLDKIMGANLVWGGLKLTGISSGGAVNKNKKESLKFLHGANTQRNPRSSFSLHLTLLHIRLSNVVMNIRLQLPFEFWNLRSWDATIPSCKAPYPHSTCPRQS